LIQSAVGIRIAPSVNRRVRTRANLRAPLRVNAVRADVRRAWSVVRLTGWRMQGVTTPTSGGWDGGAVFTDEHVDQTGDADETEAGSLWRDKDGAHSHSAIPLSI